MMKRRVLTIVFALSACHGARAKEDPRKAPAGQPSRLCQLAQAVKPKGLCPLADDVVGGLCMNSGKKPVAPMQPINLEKLLSDHLGLQVTSCEFIQNNPRFGAEVIQTKTLMKCLSLYALTNWFSDDVTGKIRVKAFARNSLQPNRQHVFNLVWRPVALPEYKWWDFMTLQTLLMKFTLRTATLCTHYPDMSIQLTSDEPIDLGPILWAQIALSDPAPRFKQVSVTTKFAPRKKGEKEKDLDAVIHLFEDQTRRPDRSYHIVTSWRPARARFKAQVEVH